MNTSPEPHPIASPREDRISDSDHPSSGRVEAGRFPRWIRTFHVMPLLVIVVGFLATRILYRVLGAYPYVKTWEFFYQYIDPALLREHLFQSLWYFHAQPPLFNVFLAIVLDLFPGQEDAAFLQILRGIGLGLALILYHLLASMRFPRWIAAALALFYIALPSQYIMESFLMYDYPMALFLLLGGVFLYRYIQANRTRDLVAFFLILMCIVLTRSLYHLVWFTALILFLGVIRRRDWKRILATAAIPFLICFGLYFKNWILFDTFSSSSWMGLNLTKITVIRMTFEERRQHVDRGDLSRLSLAHPFRPVGEYLDVVEVPPSTGIPVLDDVTRSTGHPNYNHRVVPAASRMYMKDALWVIRYKPKFYIKNVLKSGCMFFRPASYHLPPHRDKIRGIDTWTNRIVYGCFASEGDTIDPEPFTAGRVGWFLVFAYIVVLLYGSTRVLREWFTTRTLSGEAAFLGFAILTIVYTGVIGNLFEYGENMRFRFPLDALCLIGLALAIRGLASRRRRPDPGSDPMPCCPSSRNRTIGGEIGITNCATRIVCATLKSG